MNRTDADGHQENPPEPKPENGDVIDDPLADLIRDYNAFVRTQEKQRGALDPLSPDSLPPEGLDPIYKSFARQVLGRKLTQAEINIADELIAEGHSVIPVPTGAGRTPDFLVDGVPTEFKFVKAGGPNSLKNNIEDAFGQAKGGNIIIDIRESPIPFTSVPSEIARAEGNLSKKAGNTVSLKGRLTVLTNVGPVTY